VLDRATSPTQQLLELASLAADQQVLDIGCGVATTTIQVAQRFNAQVTAADLASLMRGGPAPAGRAPTQLLEFIRSQPAGTFAG
jgi:trans-aconitate methyltransferase